MLEYKHEYIMEVNFMRKLMALGVLLLIIFAPKIFTGISMFAVKIYFGAIEFFANVVAGHWLQSLTHLFQ